MIKPKKTSKLTNAYRVKQALHQRLQYERSQAQAVAREAYLRSIMGLSTQQERAK
jgi:hypothetical protein